MLFVKKYRSGFVHGLVLLIALLGTALRAQITGTIHGKVLDPVGSVVSQANVFLLRDTKQIAQGTSDAEGSFTLSAPGSGTYTVRVDAPGFAEQTLPQIFVADGKTAEVTVQLSVGALAQQTVVTATGTAIPESQTGASISLIDSDQIQALNKLDVLEELRLVPGAQIVLPAVPRTANHLAVGNDGRLAGLARLDAAHDLAFAELGAFVRALAQQRVIRAADVEDADFAAGDLHEFVRPWSDLAGRGDDVTLRQDQERRL